MRKIVIIVSVSYIASLKSQLLTVLSKQNVILDLQQFVIEAVMIIVGFYFAAMIAGPTTPFFSEKCK